MGKRKIIWTSKANRKLLEILEYYAHRNRNKTYSIKLYNTFRKELLTLV
jgi:toxin YoeB